MLALLTYLAVFGPAAGPVTPPAPIRTASAPSAHESSPAPSLAATPAPRTTPTSEPVLKTIVNIRVSARCSLLSQATTAAVQHALDADSQISTAIGALQTVDLSSNPIGRRNGLQRLESIADALAAQVKAGWAQVERLRAIAGTYKDKAQGKKVDAFADALAGAVGRQKKIQRDLDGFVSVMHAKEMAHIDRDEAQMFYVLFGVEDPFPDVPPRGDPLQVYTTPPPLDGVTPPGYFPPPSDTQLARYAARDFERRTLEIATDEQTAVRRFDAATDGCRIAP
jgi:hypothetical protein